MDSNSKRKKARKKEKSLNPGKVERTHQVLRKEKDRAELRKRKLPKRSSSLKRRQLLVQMHRRKPRLHRLNSRSESVSAIAIVSVVMLVRRNSCFNEIWD